MKVAIIGGGALGLAAAYELGSRGHEPQVFEVAPFLGGRPPPSRWGVACLNEVIITCFEATRILLT